MNRVKWSEPLAAITETPLKRFYNPKPPPPATYVETLKAHLDRSEQVPFKNMDVKKLVTRTAPLEASGAAFERLYDNKPLLPAAAKLRKLATFDRYLNDSIYLAEQARRYEYMQHGLRIKEVTGP